MTTKSQWMSPDLHGLVSKTKATDGKTLMDVFRSAAMDVLRMLSGEAKKDLSLEDGLTVIGNDLSAPGEGDAQTGKMVESSLGKWRHEQAVKKAKAENKEAPEYLADMFVPRYIARTKEGKLVRKEGKVVVVGNFVPVLSQANGEWQILAASGNPFWKGSDIYKLRELGLEMPKVAKLLPAMTYEEAEAFVARATSKHQANVTRSQERSQLAASLVGQRERREGPENIGAPRFVKADRRQGKRK